MWVFQILNGGNYLLHVPNTLRASNIYELDSAQGPPPPLQAHSLKKKKPKKNKTKKLYR